MKKKEEENVKFLKNLKYKKKIYKILTIILILLILYNMICLINKAFFEKNYVNIFGINLFSIDTDSMKDELNKNGLIITKKTNNQDLKIDDIITYEINDQIRTNKIINKFYDEERGEEVYITKSNLNYYPDIEKISESQIIGKKIVYIPLMGWTIKFIRSWIFSVISILVLFIMMLQNKAKMRRKKHRKKSKKYL